MNVSLTPKLEKFVEDSVASGRYSSASELIIASLQQLEGEERWLIYAREKIQRGLADAEAGRIVDGETVMEELRRAASSKIRKAS